jgi:hypothetical protein
MSFLDLYVVEKVKGKPRRIIRRQAPGGDLEEHVVRRPDDDPASVQRQRTAFFDQALAVSMQFQGDLAEDVKLRRVLLG